MDGLAHHASVGVGKKPGEQRIETVRQLAEQPGGFHVLSLAGLRQKGDDCRPDREVGEIAKLLYGSQRIDMSMVAQKKEGFGAHTEFRVPQESLHFWNGGFVARRRKNGDCLLPDFWRGMTQQSPYPRMGSSLLFHFKKGQRVRMSLGSDAER